MSRQTIPWLRSVTKLPIVLKGIQCVEVGSARTCAICSHIEVSGQDAVRAAEAGVDGILI